ncbi:MAG: hypothetical protein VX444_06560 [Pseudomonadota bacterium]|nr:hypothetical protein [Pseudomonadota bacterium]
MSPNEVGKRHDLLSLSSDFSNAAIETSNIAIRTLILINGGAVIALLALVGSLLSSGTYFDLEYFLYSMAAFAVGVLSGGIVAYLAYEVNVADFRYLVSFEELADHPFFQNFEKPEVKRRNRQRVYNAAKIVSLVSLLAFSAGIGFAGLAIWNVNEQAHSAAVRASK